MIADGRRLMLIAFAYANRDVLTGHYSDRRISIRRRQRLDFLMLMLTGGGRLHQRISFLNAYSCVASKDQA